MRHPNPTLRWLSYLVTAAALIFLYVILRYLPWGDMEALRTVYIVIAPTIAAFAGIVALVRYYAGPSNRSLLVGTGFLGAATLITYQALMNGSDMGVQMWPAVPGTLAPWCWFCARLLLSVSLFMSWWMWRREKRLGDRGRIRKAWRVYLAYGVYVVVVAAVTTINILPAIDRPQAWMHRPHELIPALFLALALAGYLMEGQWRSDPFDHWLVLFLIIGLINQAFILPFSKGRSDPMVNMVRLTSVASYLCVLMGVLSSMYQLFVQAARSAEQLSHTNLSLEKQIEERERVEHDLRVMTTTLEQRVGERTQELEASRRAALDIAEEAELSRHGAEDAATALHQSEEDLRLAHSALERKFEEMEEFLSIIAHDLKHPVVGIQGLLGLVKQDCFTRLDPDSQQNLELSLGECERMKEMLVHLSHLGRIEGIKPHREGVRLDQMVGACVERFRPEIQKRQISVEVEAPAVEAEVARSHIEEALTNLVDNALKYGCVKEGDPLKVRCEVNDGWCEICVSDTGPGIDPRFHQRVFQPFRRLRSSEEVAGSGMGLTAVRRLMLRIGGTVMLESELGGGARFTLRFPLIYDMH